MSETNSRPMAALILGVCLALGLALAGFFVARAVQSAKRFDCFVTVKGLSEREVPADLGIWPVRFRVAANDLKALQDQIAAGRKTVQQFLITTGFKEDEISSSPPQIADAQAASNAYASEKAPLFRYVATVTVLLRSSRVDDIRKAMEKSDQLVQSGIALGGGDEYAGRAEFLFTGINQIKPGMIEEATINARKAAEKFAADSNSQVGAIRRATQGPFEVNDRDSSSPHRKIVRVVTTIDYFLK